MELAANDIKIIIIRIFKDLRENIVKRWMRTIKRNKQNF